MTLSTPGVAKNVLTVGASKNSAQSFERAGVGLKVLQPPSLALRSPYIMTGAQFGPPLSDQPEQQYSVVVRDVYLSQWATQSAAHGLHYIISNRLYYPTGRVI